MMESCVKSKLGSLALDLRLDSSFKKGRNFKLSFARYNGTQ